MSVQLNKTEPESPKRKLDLTTNIMLTAFIVTFCLLIVNFAYDAFTHNTPIGLQWALGSLLSLIAFAAVVNNFINWKRQDRIVGWLNLFGWTFLLVGLIWCMLFTHDSFHHKLQNSLRLGIVPLILTKLPDKIDQIKKRRSPHP